MEESSPHDIRRLLKEFGIQVDELVSAHLESHPDLEKLKVVLILEERTDYGDSPPDKPLHLEIE